MRGVSDRVTLPRAHCLMGARYVSCQSLRSSAFLPARSVSVALGVCEVLEICLPTDFNQRWMESRERVHQVVDVAPSMPVCRAVSKVTPGYASF